MSSSTNFAIVIDIDGAGSHPASWRVAGAAPDELLSARWISRAVTAAERAGFTAVTFEDHPLPASAVDGLSARIDAVIQASFSAPLTGSIGLIPVVQVAYSEPFHVATQIASLDTASHGRAGWIVRADPDPAIAARYGREPLPVGAEDEELTDVVEAVRRLWDSWEDDAVIRDVETGRYLDRDKLHYADFEGHRFSVKGPSILPRSPQGQPLVIAEAGTDAEIDVALIDTPLATLTGEVARARSRQGVGVRVFLQLEVALDHAGLTGDERVSALDNDALWVTDGRARYVGDADGLVGLLSSLSGVVDGVRIHPAVLDVDLDEIGRAVLPQLQHQGVFVSPRAGVSLRHSLGLQHPANRFVEVNR
ncbi:MAG: hypothetical protein JWP75_270 [Frondihabitans sp.]|nr:hypothetical protein [Frondihabitans sp.]